MKFYSNREQEIFEEITRDLPGKKNAADLKLLQAFAVEMATYEEACEKLVKKKTVRRGTGGEGASPWVAIRNQAIKNAQNITKLLGISELAKAEEPVAHVTKLDIFKNDKKNIIQKSASR